MPKCDAVFEGGGVKGNRLAGAVASASLFVLLLASLLAAGPSHAADQAELLQQQAIQRIDGFVDLFRTSGDRTTRLPQLQQAERELIASYRAFLSRGDLVAGALSLIKLGDARRMLDRGDDAMEAYREAERLARQANQPAHEVKALLGQAKVEFLFLMRRNLGAAAWISGRIKRARGFFHPHGVLGEGIPRRCSANASRKASTAAGGAESEMVSPAAASRSQWDSARYGETHRS